MDLCSKDHQLVCSGCSQGLFSSKETYIACWIIRCDCPLNYLITSGSPNPNPGNFRKPARILHRIALLKTSGVFSNLRRPIRDADDITYTKLQ